MLGTFYLISLQKSSLQ